MAPDDEELEELLVVVWANRLQNRVAITSCRPEHGPEHTPCTTASYILDYKPNKITNNLPDELAKLLVISDKQSFFLQNNRQKISCLFQVLQFSFTDICGMSLWAEPKDFQAPVPSRTGLFFLLPRERENNVFNAVVHLDLVSALSQEEDGKAAEPKLHWHGGAYDVDELAGYDQERDEL